MPNKKLIESLNAWIETEEPPKGRFEPRPEFSHKDNSLATLLSLVYYVGRSLTYYKIIITESFIDNSKKNNFSAKNSISIERAIDAIGMINFLIKDYLKKFIQESKRDFHSISEHSSVNIESLKKIHACLETPNTTSLKTVLTLQGDFFARHRAFVPKFSKYTNSFLTKCLIFIGPYANDYWQREELSKRNELFSPFLNIKSNSPRSTYQKLLTNFGLPEEELSSEKLERVKEKVDEYSREIEKLDKKILDFEQEFQKNSCPEFFEYILLWNLLQMLYQIAYDYQKSLPKELNKNNDSKDTLPVSTKKGKSLSTSAGVFSLTRTTYSPYPQSFTPPGDDDLSLEDCKNRYGSSSLRATMRQS